MLGCYDSRITFYSQQVRALALAHALFEQRHLPANARIAVIGGGAGGVTSAAALAVTGDFRVYLFERSDELIPLQRAATRRRIDPHIYDWPKEDARHEFAELPLLDWQSGPANQVREDVLREFAAVRAAVGARLDVFLRYDVRSVVPAGPDYEIAFEREPTPAEMAQWVDRANGHMRIDLVIFAFGFGLEPNRPIPNTNTESYWSDAGIHLTKAIKERDYLTRRDAQENSHRVSVAFNCGDSFTRSATQSPSIEAIIALLKTDR